MIEFKDFAAEIKSTGFFTKTYETMDDALEKANGWISKSGVDVINVETVLLPNLWREEGTEDVDLHTRGEMSSTWHQFIRVWYRV